MKMIIDTIGLFLRLNKMLCKVSRVVPDTEGALVTAEPFPTFYHLKTPRICEDKQKVPVIMQRGKFLHCK